MSTTTTAASNGSTDAPAASQPERLSGMARVREAAAWRTASVAHDAAFEAERLCYEIHSTVNDAYQQGGSTAAEAAASRAVRDKVQEARTCLFAAANFLNALINGASEDPPF